jgi:hypothetical protein
MVEAPGYCPPGPKCLFHLTVYRHSRSPGTDEIGILRVNLKRGAVIAALLTGFMGNLNAMKRLAFAMVGTAALALAACNNNKQDAVQNAELNQPESDLNEIANQAAMDAANAQAAAQANIENAQKEQNAVVDNAVNPQEADEQNVSAM